LLLKHNDLATLFLSSSHDTITNLMRTGNTPGQPYVAHFTEGSLALYNVVYVLLMSVGAGVAIPAGLFMPSMLVGASWGVLWGQVRRPALQRGALTPPGWPRGRERGGKL
jgi:chloride channel 7